MTVSKSIVLFSRFKDYKFISATGRTYLEVNFKLNCNSENLSKIISINELMYQNYAILGRN